MRGPARVTVALLAALALPTGAARAAGNGHLLGGSAVAVPPAEEAALVLALRDVQESRLDRALERLEGLLRQRPNFQLAQLVYADLLLAKAGPITGMGNHPSADREQLRDLRDEARRRLRHHLDAPPADALPAPLVRLAPEHKQAIVVDVAQSRLYVYANDEGGVRLLADFYASTGKNGSRKQSEGDQKTPLGVYFVTGSIERERLPDLYGVGAFPVSYPNEWDRRLGRTGHGIWIHGVPTDTYSRPPMSSDGCVALANADLERLGPLLEAPATPVIIGEGLAWEPPAVVAARYAAFRRDFDAWIADWESLDEDRYASHYSHDFRGPAGRDRDAWLRYKRWLNTARGFVDVEVDELSVFGYPGERDLLVVSFVQDYRSESFAGRLRKRQYWRREPDGVWRIVFEGRA